MLTRLSQSPQNTHTSSYSYSSQLGDTLLCLVPSVAWYGLTFVFSNESGLEYGFTVHRSKDMNRERLGIGQTHSARRSKRTTGSKPSSLLP